MSRNMEINNSCQLKCVLVIIFLFIRGNEKAAAVAKVGLLRRVTNNDNNNNDNNNN